MPNIEISQDALETLEELIDGEGVKDFSDAILALEETTRVMHEHYARQKERLDRALQDVANA